MLDQIKVTVYGTVHIYPADIASYGEHLASGGETVSLAEARRQARAFYAAGEVDGWVTGVDFWAHIDESGLAYRLTFDVRGHYRISAAAPMSGYGNVRDLYDANGYGHE